MPNNDPTPKLDRIDKAILRELQSNGRIPNVELARRVKLSPSPCLERVKRLEARGYIRAYQAKLDPKLLNLDTAAFVEVTLDRSTSDVFDQFRAAVIHLPEVEECHMLAGGFDYLLKLRISGVAQYRTVLSKLVDLPGVAQTHTYMVIEEIKQNQGLAI